MAKAKKLEPPIRLPPKAQTAPAAGKSTGPPKPTKPAAPKPAPLIDTSLAAQAAAQMVANKALLGATPAPADSEPEQGEAKESSTFKQLKESLAKPGSKTLGTLLQSTTNPAARKSNLPLAGGKQVGHNQTFGPDVTRTGVPRRTSG